jgi:hypothetical protein
MGYCAVSWDGTLDSSGFLFVIVLSLFVSDSILLVLDLSSTWISLRGGEG